MDFDDVNAGGYGVQLVLQDFRTSSQSRGREGGRGRRWQLKSWNIGAFKTSQLLIKVVYSARQLKKIMPNTIHL